MDGCGEGFEEEVGGAGEKGVSVRRLRICIRYLGRLGVGLDSDGHGGDIGVGDTPDRDSSVGHGVGFWLFHSRYMYVS